MATEQTTPAQILDLLDDLAANAKKRGVTGFSFHHDSKTERSISVRNGNIEKIEGSNPVGVSLTVFFGEQSGNASTNSLHPADLKQTLDDAITLAKISSADPNRALTNPEDIVKSFVALELNDPYTPDDARLIDLAMTVEAAALANPKITNSDAAAASHLRAISTFLASNGFRAQQVESSNTFYASVIAGKEDMQSDYAVSSATWHEDLQSADVIGRLAAERAVARLNPVKLQTSTLPVVFDPRVSGSLVGAFLSAIRGNAIYRKSSFLLDMMGQPIMPEGIDIVDDPLIIRGVASGSFDSQGIARRKTTFVENGVLKSWMMDVQSAKKLGLRSTGHASGTGNLYISPGKVTPAELIADIKDGIYLTGFDGGASDPLTGEYSYGAKGLLIQNGLITSQAFSEITIAGQLSEMFKTMVLANDVNFADFKHKGILSPTIKIPEMSIGGN